MEKLVNVENEWSDGIDANKVKGAVRRIEVEEVQCAMNGMKIRKISENKIRKMGLLLKCLRLVRISV